MLAQRYNHNASGNLQPLQQLLLFVLLLVGYGLSFASNSLLVISGVTALMTAIAAAIKVSLIYRTRRGQ